MRAKAARAPRESPPMLTMPRVSDVRSGGYEPLRPDFMEVAGGLSARTTGGFGTCWGTAVSGTLCGWELFFFFEKSGISFFLFI